MTTIEDRLRAATRAAAATVAPGSAPPLHLPDPRAGRRRPRRPGGRWPGWLTPLAAALATAAVVAAAEGVTLLVGGGSAPQRPAARPAAIPPYYVVVPPPRTGLGPAGAALVRATATGRLLATVRLPDGGSFSAVAAAGDDRTFVLAARVAPGFRLAGQATPRTPAAGPHPGAPALRFFRLALGPGGTAPRLSALRLQPPSGADLTGLALTPDGTRLAISLQLGGRSAIEVFSLGRGQVRAWAGTAPPPVQAGVPGGSWIHGLSWASDDRTLAYQDRFHVRLLDTAAPGSRLPRLDPALPTARMLARASGERVTLSCLTRGPYPQPGGSALLTADGGQIVGIGSFLPRPGEIIAGIPRSLWHGGFTFPCPAAGLRVVRARLRPVRWGSHAGWPAWLYWASPDGRSLIASVNFGLGGRGVVGVLRAGRFTALAGSPGIPVDPAPPDAPAAW